MVIGKDLNNYTRAHARETRARARARKENNMYNLMKIEADKEEFGTPNDIKLYADTPWHILNTIETLIKNGYKVIVISQATLEEIMTWNRLNTPEE